MQKNGNTMGIRSMYANKKKTIIKISTLVMFCLILGTLAASGYTNIPMVGEIYGYGDDVRIHLGDDTDDSLSSPAPESVSYTYSFTQYKEAQRDDIRLVLTVVNVLPAGSKNEMEYNDDVYINDVKIGNLNDFIEGTDQDYVPTDVEFIFRSDLIHTGENTLTITSGSNADGTNYDDFAVESIYMEQYGKIKHWLYSYISPDSVALLLTGTLIILAGGAIYINKTRDISVIHQFITAGVLGIIFGMILFIKLNTYFGFIFLIPIVIAFLSLFIGLMVLVTAKYLLKKDIHPQVFIKVINPLILLTLTFLSFILSSQYLFFSPGGPMPTYGVPVHRPETGIDNVIEEEETP